MHIYIHAYVWVNPRCIYTCITNKHPYIHIDIYTCIGRAGEHVRDDDHAYGLALHICMQTCMHVYIYRYTDVFYTKGTRAHTHRELIREWLWARKGSSLEYI